LVADPSLHGWGVWLIKSKADDRLIGDLGFKTNEVDLIIAECLDSNLPSIRVLEKVGMNRTGQIDEMIYWELKSGSS
jgi:ribosomal-protein-alanine N-acetyltransferase